MPNARRHVALIVGILVCLILGLIMAGGGIKLITLGGSWYYLFAGLALLATAALLFQRRTLALGVYAVFFVISLLWALWESGLQWWPLAARMDILFLLGLYLLTPWVTRPLRGHSSSLSQESDAQVVDRSAVLSRRGRWSGLAPLAVSLTAFAVIAIVSWFIEPFHIEGSLPAARASVSGQATATKLAASTENIPQDAWHAYGRSGYGQRYSPLVQITPNNVDTLEVAWHYHTGDEQQPGDPIETTFQVTPLKIEDRVYLCTPHQSVIALDAVSGKEVWRNEIKVQEGLALQHLTCRGLSYYSGRGSTEAVQGELNSEQGRPFSEEPEPPANQPVASNGARVAEHCDAKLFFPTADGRVVALRPDDGAVCADFGNGTGQINLWANQPVQKPGGAYSTSPVVIANDRLIVGGTVLDNVSVNEASGVIRGYDVNTGRLVWNWDSGNPDVTTPLMRNQTYVQNSPNAWSILSVDEDLGMVYLPMANAPPDQWGADRPEEFEKYGSAITALDIGTGQVQWSFQVTHHDLWDYDIPSQSSLLNLSIDGKTVPALVQPTKQGEIFVLNRKTGEPVLAVTEMPAPQGAAPGDHTAPTQPVSKLSFDPVALREADMWGATMLDQLICRIKFKELRYEGRFTPPSEKGTLVYPGNFGVFNWDSIAVDPERQVAFMAPSYVTFVSRLIPRADDTERYVQGDDEPKGSLPALNENFGAPYAVQLHPFLSPLGIPCQQPPWGYVAGADLTTGNIVWMHKNGTVRDSSPLPLPFAMGVPTQGGPIMTKGGVAFLTGTLDNYVRAYDITTGEEIWKERLPAGGQATPMTYEGSDGRQYLLVVAGGHGSIGTTAGDSIIAYTLPK